MTSSNQSLDSETLFGVAMRLADASGRETLHHFRSDGLKSESKQAAFDPVTEADRAAERAMRRILGEERPEDSILGEEYGETPGTSGLTWILDPIDGTRGFISGTPTWGTLIALSDENGPRLGIIDQPYIGERFIGGFGRANLVGPGGTRTLRTKPPVPISEAILFTTFPEIGTEREAAAFGRVAADVRLTRYGMDCYAYALVASGQVDLVIEAGLNPYDIAAPMAVIEAAGGIVTDWSGGPAQGGGQILAAANPEIHAAALERLAG